MKKLLLLPILLASCYIVAGPQRPHEAIPEPINYCTYTSQDTAYCKGLSGYDYNCVYGPMEWHCRRAY